MTRASQAASRLRLQVLDGQWDAAIRQALAEDSRATVFVERREDLTVEAASGDYPTATHTVWDGACVEHPERPLIFHSALLPDHLDDLISARPPEDTSIRGMSARIDSRPGVVAVSGAIVEAQKRLPDARFRARWVEFDQRVKIGCEGAVLDDRRSSRRLRVDAWIQRQGRSSSASVEAVVQDDHNCISSLLDEVLQRLVMRLDAEKAISGPTTVVFSPSVAGIWIHELVGHAAEADAVSWLTPEIDRLHEHLTVIDDPRRARAAWSIDDEGTPVRPVALILDGRPKERLHSRRTASESGAKTTGHGRRGSYRESVLPRMGCTFIANGTDDPDEILQNVNEGIYIRRMDSAHTEPTTGRAVFRVTDADRIEKGKRTVPLRAHLLETVAGQALAAIDGIGSDLAFDRCLGTCHRQGQPLVTSVGGPTFCTRLTTVRS
jgi:hypothetical protein